MQSPVDVILRDGTTLRLRPPGEADAPSLVAFFEGLSTTSRFLRFHGLPQTGHRFVATLVELFAWSEDEFLRKTEGSAIRRIGYERWSRNIAVALGNATPDAAIVAALAHRADDPSPLVREHVAWALHAQRLRAAE